MIDLTAVGVLTVIGATIYALFELYARRKERLLMIEKMSELSGGGLKNLAYNPFNLGSGGKYTALKIGLLLMGVGLGLILAYCMINGVLPESVAERSYQRRDDVEMIYAASTLFFGGLGLLTAFIVEHRMTKKCEK